jgi:hypothetical protein
LKTFITILLFFLTVISNAQEEAKSDLSYTLKEVSKMAVYPGCEKMKANDNNALLNCFAEKLHAEFSKRLQPYVAQFEKEGFVSAVSKIRFKVTKEGKLEGIYPLQRKNISQVDLKLDQISVQIFENVAQNLKRIEPAKIENSVAVNLQFDLPVTLKVSNEANLKFKWKEFTILSLKNKELHYEIRENRNKKSSYKIYEIKNGKEIYLDSSDSLDKILEMEPYQNVHLTGEKNLMVEKVVNNIHLKINYSENSKEKLEVYSVENGENILRELINFSQLKFSELYLKAVLR